MKGTLTLPAETMTNFTIELAGVVVTVVATYESTRAYCEKYISAKAPDFCVMVTEEDLAYEREKCAREDRIEGKPVRNMPDTALEITAVQRKITEQLFDRDILLFHGSVVAVDGKGYLFTAKSGTGKSTHTRLWRERFGDRAVMVNDDKPFLQILADRVIACGSPWNGKHGLGENIRVPLKAICILERGSENRIRQIPAKEAVFMLLQQSNRPMDSGKLPGYLKLIDGLSEKVPFYRMQCTMEPEAADVAHEAMAEE